MNQTEAEKLVEDFSKSIREGLGVAFSEAGKIDAETTKRVVSKMVSKQLMELDFPEPEIEAEILWNTMSRFEKAKWHLYRRWPLRKIAEKVRAKIDGENHTRWEANKKGDLHAFSVPAEYPNIFHPGPKRVVVMKIKAIAPPNHPSCFCNVEVNI